MVQAGVLLATLTFTSLGVGGSYLIRQKFEPELLLPAESYLRCSLGLGLQMCNLGVVADSGRICTTPGTRTTAGLPRSTPATSTTPTSPASTLS